MNNIWWSKVTNAVLFIGEIVQELENEKSIILQLPQYVPWYDEFKEIIEKRIYEGSSRHTLKCIDDSSEDPGKIILTEFCKPEMRNTFRPSIGYPKFLADSENVVLNDRIVWVYNIPNDRQGAWVDFVSDYQSLLGKKRQGAVFVLEFRDNFDVIHKKGVKCLSYNNAISEYDTYVFNMLVASFVASKYHMKRYLCELISLVIGNDVELAAKCVEGDNYKAFLQDPRKVIEKIIEQDYRSDYEKFSFEMDDEELKKRIWKAQIKTVFPVIEE